MIWALPILHKKNLAYLTTNLEVESPTHFQNKS